ncbi:hypothetical protein Hte_009099 [Hypoxylon texense]
MSDEIQELDEIGELDEMGEMGEFGDIAEFGDIGEFDEIEEFDEIAEFDLDEEIEEQAEELRTVFTNGPRFQFIKTIGHGQLGTAFHVQLNDPALPHIRDFIVKRAFDDDNAVDDLRNEKRILDGLRGNRHIVRTLDIPDNPLSTALQEGTWMIQEWIPRGDLAEFMDKYPGRGETIPTDQKPSGIAHGDLHWKNVMLEDPPADGEHRFAPLLKVIDFGQSRVVEENDPTGATGEQENIRAVGGLMSDLLVPVQRAYEDEGWPETEWEGKKFQTAAIQLNPLPEGVSPTLASLVSACMALKPKNRPTLAQLFEIVRRQVLAPAGDKPEEQDDAISKYWKDIDCHVCVPNDQFLDASAIFTRLSDTYEPGPKILPQIESLLHTYPRLKQESLDFSFYIMPTPEYFVTDFDETMIGHSTNAVSYPKLDDFAQSLVSTHRWPELAQPIDGMDRSFQDESPGSNLRVGTLSENPD